MSDEDHKVIDTMKTYGGSFIKALALAFERADYFNYRKLQKAFPDYWKKYKKMSE